MKLVGKLKRTPKPQTKAMCRIVAMGINNKDRNPKPSVITAATAGLNRELTVFFTATTVS